MLRSWKLTVPVMRVRDASTPSKLDEVFSEILDDLHHQYLLSYPAPDDMRDGKYHKIKVVAGYYDVSNGMVMLLD